MLTQEVYDTSNRTGDLSILNRPLALLILVSTFIPKGFGGVLLERDLNYYRNGGVQSVKQSDRPTDKTRTLFPVNHRRPGLPLWTQT